MMLSQNAKAFSVESLIKDDKCRVKEKLSRPQGYSLPHRGHLGRAHRDDCRGPPYHHGAVQTSPDSPRGRVTNMEVCHDDLWQSFHSLGTEMIITKTGRRMFPALRVKCSGLKADTSYRVFLDFVPIDANKYRYVYHSSKWMVAGPGDCMIPDQFYEHPDSPVEGAHLDGQVISFERLKLTNSNTPKEGQISLVSMQKFQPCIRIVELGSRSFSEVAAPSPVNDGMVFTFPQTSFMAVTAYQNQEITRLKIARNPFAKGFRESGKTRSSLDTIMASFGFTMSPNKYACTKMAEGFRKIKQENIGDMVDGSPPPKVAQQTTTNTISLAPNTYLLQNTALHLSGTHDYRTITKPSHPLPAHIPGLYPLEWTGLDQDGLSPRLFCLQSKFGMVASVLPEFLVPSQTVNKWGSYPRQWIHNQYDGFQGTFPMCFRAENNNGRIDQTPREPKTNVQVISKGKRKLETNVRHSHHKLKQRK